MVLGILCVGCRFFFLFTLFDKIFGAELPAAPLAPDAQALIGLEFDALKNTQARIINNLLVVAGCCSVVRWTVTRALPSIVVGAFRALTRDHWSRSVRNCALSSTCVGMLK